ncbi:MAG: serine/threonine protein kinase [Pirellula sp.]
MSSEILKGKLLLSFAYKLGIVNLAELEIILELWRGNPNSNPSSLLISRGLIDAQTSDILANAVEAEASKYGGNLQAAYERLITQNWFPEILSGQVPLPDIDDVTSQDLGKTKLVLRANQPDDVNSTISLGSYASGGSRYRIGRLIAEGGQGKVYEAVDTELNRVVLLKQLSVKLEDNPEARGRFIRETRTGAILEHPGIVPVYDIGQHPGGRLFQVMRYFRPGSLHKKIAVYHKENPNSLNEMAFRSLLTHFAAACRAIDFAHSRGIHHLDIKPNNIVTGEFGETQIIDWGLAQVTDGDMLEKVEEESGMLLGGSSRSDSGGLGKNSKTKIASGKPRGFCGTKSYAAPEQWQEDWSVIGKKADIYGLGATLFEILSGRPPYDPKSPTIAEDVEIGNLHNEFQRWVTPGLRAICLKAMAIKQEDRYGTAGELADDVERFLADEPLEAYPDPWQVQLWRFVKRNKTAVATITALLATSTIALAVGNVLVSQQRDLARKNAAMTREVISEFIESVADDDWSSIPGTGPLRLEAVSKVTDMFPGIIALQPSDPDVSFDAAEIYRSCANLYRLLGNTTQAQVLYDESKELNSPLIEKYPRESKFQVQKCMIQLDEAEVALRERGPDAACGNLKTATDNAKEFNSRFKSFDTRCATAMALADYSVALLDAGLYKEAAVESTEAVKGYGLLIDQVSDPDKKNEMRMLASLAAATATRAMCSDGRLKEADEMSLKATILASELIGERPGDPNVEYTDAIARLERVGVLAIGNPSDKVADEMECQGLDQLRKLVADSKLETNFRPVLCEYLSLRAERLISRGQFSQAIELADEAIGTIAMLDRPTGAIEAKLRLAFAIYLRGVATKALGDTSGAKSFFQKAKTYYVAVMPSAKSNQKIIQQSNHLSQELGN